MRAVFINHCHPDTPHVCGLRLTSFALVMAARGHQIVLLTEALDEDDQGQDLTALAGDLAHHDWAVPYSLAVKPLPNGTLARLRQGQLPNGWRQLMIAGYYLCNSGLYGNWRKAVFPYLKILAEDFQPEVIWASFGNTDVWNIGSDLSGLTNRPWVADMKDNWSAFLPTGFKQMIANRFRTASAMTAFSGGHQAEVRQWFGTEAEVIYSGFDEVSVVAGPLEEKPRILLTGSLYAEDQTKILIGGIHAWLKQREAGAGQIELCYAGGDGERVRQYTNGFSDLCDLVINDYLSLDELRSLQAGAWVNAYMYSPRSLFQHKPLELLAAGRPVLACPGECQEVLDIARDVGGNLNTCGSIDEVVAFLNSVDSDGSGSLDLERMNAYSWQGQAVALERVLDKVRQGR